MENNRTCFHCGKELTDNNDSYLKVCDFVFFLCNNCFENLKSRIDVLCLEFLGEAPKDIKKYGAWIPVPQYQYYQCSLCGSRSDEAIEICKVCHAQMHK